MLDRNVARRAPISPFAGNEFEWSCIKMSQIWFGGPKRIRTADPRIANAVLYQLSYGPVDVGIIHDARDVCYRRSASPITWSINSEISTPAVRSARGTSDASVIPGSVFTSKA